VKNKKRSHEMWILLGCAIICGILLGCNGDGPGPISNPDPGENNLHIVAAFGDSITRGSECPCTPYPARLAGMIGKDVRNLGIGGSQATASVGRTKDTIKKHRPAFMLILYGVNDVIHGQDRNAILGAIQKMVAICKENHVVPVLATYPPPTREHRIFGGGVERLNNGIRDLARLEGIRLVDLEKEFSVSYDTSQPGRRIPIADETLYMPDGLHPNDAGTHIMAMAFADLF